MAIRSGIGIGEAQVFDTSGLANQYARQVVADQKAQAAQAEIQRKAAEKYNEELADLIANVKTEGARDNDVPDITKAYNDIKDFYTQSAKLKDTDRPLFRAELRNKINALNEFAQRSNKLSKDVAAMSGEIAKNEWDYDPNSVLELKRINQTPLKQLGADAVIDPMKYKRLPNFKMIEDILDKTYDLGKENAKFVGDVSVKGKTVGVSKVAPEFINTALIQSVQNSPEAKYALKSLYTKTTGNTQPTDEELGSFLRKQYETRHRYDYEGSPQKVAKSGGAGSDVVVSAPIKLNIPFADGKGSVDVPDYVKLPLPKQNFAGSNYIDMATGKPSTEALESSNDYEVVGVGNFPIITKGNMKGSLSQPKFARENRGAVQLKPMVHVQKVTAGGYKEDLLIPYDRLPASAKTKKALANFTPSVGKPTIPTGVKAASTAKKGTEFKSKSGIKVTVE